MIKPAVDLKDRTVEFRSVLRCKLYWACFSLMLDVRAALAWPGGGGGGGAVHINY